MTEKNAGFTLWCNGLPSSGKSTLVRALAKGLQERGYERVEILEEGGCNQDYLSLVNGDLRKLVLLADLLARNGIITLVTSVSPKRELRQEIRKKHHAPLISVFLDAPEEVLLDRDSKGFYRQIVKQGRSQLRDYFASFEKPIAPDIHLNTWKQQVEESSEMVLQEMERFLGIAFGSIQANNHDQQEIIPSNTLVPDTFALQQGCDCTLSSPIEGG